jgi:hypothetical protein
MDIDLRLHTHLIRVPSPARIHAQALAHTLTHTHAQVLFLQQDKRLVLKSPPHTARVRLLREIFPGAKFVHISRDPYEIYQSTKRVCVGVCVCACVCA